MRWSRWRATPWTGPTDGRHRRRPRRRGAAGMILPRYHIADSLIPGAGKQDGCRYAIRDDLRPHLRRQSFEHCCLRYDGAVAGGQCRRHLHQQLIALRSDTADRTARQQCIGVALADRARQLGGITERALQAFAALGNRGAGCGPRGLFEIGHRS